MAILTHYTQEQRHAISERIGAHFDLPDAGMKIAEEGWSLEHFGGDSMVTLKVELIKHITREEAEAIMSAKPLEA